jgi:RHS repeat-associated protein
VAVNRHNTYDFTGGVAYLGKDILGSVRSVSNEWGRLAERYEYDAFGKPRKGDFTNGVGLGYTGKPYDTVTGMYNYRYRDYAPEAARFTTVDPIRDGNNWFAYVNNDPVNWRDPWGLSASDPRITESRPVSQAERDAYTKATGHSIEFDSIRIIEGRGPTVAEVSSAAKAAGYNPSPYPSDQQIESLVKLGPGNAISMPDGYISTGSKNPSVDLIGHELNHQDTYQNGATTTYGGDTKEYKTAGEVFEELVKERQMPDPYNLPGTLEYQADQVQDIIIQQQNFNNGP